MALESIANLLMTTGTESHTIESSTGYIYDNLIDAVRDSLIGTELLALRLGPDDIPGSSIDIQLADKDSMVIQGPIGEGVEIPYGIETISELTIKPLKYGTLPFISEEMIEDSKFALLDRNIQEAGYQMANKIDQLILYQIQNGADTCSTPKNSACTGLTVSGICEAMRLLEDDGYLPTDLIVQSSEAMDLRQIDSFHEADKSGGVSPQDRLIGKIYGMKVWVSNNVYTSGDSLVLDRKHALVYAEKRPITIKNYDAVNRDCRGVVATMRVGASYLRKEACCTITVS